MSETTGHDVSSVSPCRFVPVLMPFGYEDSCTVPVIKHNVA